MKKDDWTEDDISDLKEVIYSWIAEDENRAPASLRYSFHSCTGGCDGCINMEDPDNGGLESVHGSLNALYDKTLPFSDGGLTMSRADFNVLAGIAGVEYTIKLNNDHCGNEACIAKEVYKLCR